MVTVTLMKTAVTKNLANQLLFALNIITFPKVFDNPANILFLGGCPGILWLPLRDATAQECTITMRVPDALPKKGRKRRQDRVQSRIKANQVARLRRNNYVVVDGVEGYKTSRV